MDDSVKALDAALEGTEPLSEEDVARSMRLVSQRAWAARREHHEMAERLAKAESAASRKYLEAHAESFALHPKRRVPEHETIARLAAADEEAEALLARLLHRSLTKELDVLEKLLSVLQTQAKSFRMEHQAA